MMEKDLITYTCSASNRFIVNSMLYENRYHHVWIQTELLVNSMLYENRYCIMFLANGSWYSILIKVNFSVRIFPYITPFCGMSGYDNYSPVSCAYEIQATFTLIVEVWGRRSIIYYFQIVIVVIFTCIFIITHLLVLCIA